MRRVPPMTYECNQCDATIRRRSATLLPLFGSCFPCCRSAATIIFATCPAVLCRLVRARRAAIHGGSVVRLGSKLVLAFIAWSRRPWLSKVRPPIPGRVNSVAASGALRRALRGRSAAGWVASGARCGSAVRGRLQCRSCGHRSQWQLVAGAESAAAAGSEAASPNMDLWLIAAIFSKNRLQLKNAVLQ